MAQFRYLQPEDIRRLESYEFAPKAIVEGYLSGRHRSRARGSSIEFHDYRQYTAGDDPALVDWRVFARTDRHYLRVFEQETNMECHLFLDSSASMGFGERVTKLEFASFFVAALAYLVVRNGDRVSLQIFDAEIREHFPAGSTRRHLHTLLGALERNEPGSQTSLATALRRAEPLLRRKGTLVIASDFLESPGAIFSALNPYLHRGFRVHLFHVIDPEELELPRRGLSAFVDMESGARLVTHPESVRAAYRDAVHDHIQQLRRLAVTRRIEYALARTDRSIFELFDRFVASTALRTSTP